MKEKFFNIGLSVAELKAKHHELALELHPDHGGDPDMFADMQLEFEYLLHESQQSKGCMECHGTGKLMITRGFTVIYVPCLTCDGTGEILS